MKRSIERPFQMGRQILLSMMPEDVESLLTYIKSRHCVVVAKRDDANSAAIESLASLPRNGNETLILWNQELLAVLRRTLVTGSTHGNYYRVDETALPVLEFKTSILGRWRGKPSLTQGRIYGVFDNKSKTFLRWFEQISGHIGKAFMKNPTSLSGYIGPAAYKWFREGGLLLPTFLPPNTSEWRKFFDNEATIRGRLNATSPAHKSEG
jgi:hypothetical protein